MEQKDQKEKNSLMFTWAHNRDYITRKGILNTHYMPNPHYVPSTVLHILCVLIHLIITTLKMRNLPCHPPGKWQP